MKKRIIITIALLLVSVAVLVGGKSRSESSLDYRLVSITEGNVESLVEATGALQATTTVQVGAQVSGQIDRITVDFNDRVKAGQVIARINPTILQTEVNGAKADLKRCQAEEKHRQTEQARIARLHDESLVSDSELETAKYRLEVAMAEVQAATVSLERAWQNLAFTEITAPVDGVVINRNVDVGQTVASNFSSPLLFLIAEDLTQLEILVSVDESDIGQIVEGQNARFTVQAFPDQIYEGTVQQIRLQSTRQENVVNYTVVVEVGNKNGELLPGMTATVDFLIEVATNVMVVPNAALRFRPSEEMIGHLNEGGKDRSAGGGEKSKLERMVPLFVLDAAGLPEVILVRAGLSDGSITQVTGPHLEAGLQIVVGVTGESKKPKNNPFQNNNSNSRGSRPGPRG